MLYNIKLINYNSLNFKKSKKFINFSFFFLHIRLFFFIFFIKKWFSIFYFFKLLFLVFFKKYYFKYFFFIFLQIRRLINKSIKKFLLKATDYFFFSFIVFPKKFRLYSFLRSSFIYKKSVEQFTQQYFRASLFLKTKYHYFLFYYNFFFFPYFIHKFCFKNILLKYSNLKSE